MIKMCQITHVGSCHFDAIQTEDACLSCADGGIVSVFNAGFHIGPWIFILGY